MANQTQKAKLDVTGLVDGFDKLLEVTDDPLRHQIVRNFRRHHLLEVAGRYEDIFEDDMTVEEPHYLLSWGDAELELQSRGEVREFYQGLMDARAEVMTITDSSLTVDDEGIFTFAQYHNYRHGEDLIAEGAEVDDPDGLYIMHFRSVVYYVCDNQGRLLGEQVGLSGPAEIEKVPPERFITREEAQENLEPLIQPLPDLPEPRENRDVGSANHASVGNVLTQSW